VFRMKVRHRWIVADPIVQDAAVVLMGSLVQLIPIVAVVCAAVVPVKVGFCEGSTRTSHNICSRRDVFRWCSE
jgi:hypothetical protein